MASVPQILGLGYKGEGSQRAGAFAPTDAWDSACCMRYDADDPCDFDQYALYFTGDCPYGTYRVRYRRKRRYSLVETKARLGITCSPLAELWEDYPDVWTGEASGFTPCYSFPNMTPQGLMCTQQTFGSLYLRDWLGTDRWGIYDAARVMASVEACTPAGEPISEAAVYEFTFYPHVGELDIALQYQTAGTVCLNAAAEHWPRGGTWSLWGTDRAAEGHPRYLIGPKQDYRLSSPVYKKSSTAPAATVVVDKSKVAGTDGPLWISHAEFAPNLHGSTFAKLGAEVPMTSDPVRDPSLAMAVEDGTLRLDGEFLEAAATVQWDERGAVRKVSVPLSDVGGAWEGPLGPVPYDVRLYVAAAVRDDDGLSTWAGYYTVPSRGRYTLTPTDGTGGVSVSMFVNGGGALEMSEEPTVEAVLTQGRELPVSRHGKGRTCTYNLADCAVLNDGRGQSDPDELRALLKSCDFWLRGPDGLLARVAVKSVSWTVRRGYTSFTIGMEGVS